MPAMPTPIIIDPPTSPPSKAIHQTNPQDVLLGRGNLTKLHPGNKHYRNLISAAKPQWRGCNLDEKRDIARQIMRMIHSIGSPPGRFLKFDKVRKCWEEAAQEEAFLKTKKALRDHRREEGFPANSVFGKNDIRCDEIKSRLYHDTACIKTNNMLLGLSNVDPGQMKEHEWGEVEALMYKSDKSFQQWDELVHRCNQLLRMPNLYEENKTNIISKHREGFRRTGTTFFDVSIAETAGDFSASDNFSGRDSWIEEPKSKRAKQGHKGTVHPFYLPLPIPTLSNDENKPVMCHRCM